MSRSRAGYVVALALGLLCWSTVPVFIRYLNEHLGNFTQNLYRYIAACVLLWVLSAALFRRYLSFGRGLIVLLGPMAVICVHQLLWVESIRLTSPTTASLLTQFQVVIVGLLAWVFFREERSTILSARFVGGTALALVGVGGFILTSGEALKGSVGGCFVVLLTAAVWAVYTIVAKAAIRGMHPVVAFTWVCTGVLVFFLVTTPVFGEPGKVLEVPVGVQVALVVSGMIGIALAHLFFYTALSGLSAAVCGTSILVLPLLTGTWSYRVFKEKLSGVQVLFGVLLLVGAGLTLIRPKPSPSGPRPAPPVEGPPD